MRVLITGVSGFVGRHLAALCRERGAVVVGLGRTPADAGLERELDVFALADLADAEATAAAVRSARPERVFHLAAVASVAASWRDPGGTIAANLAAAQHLLEAVRREAPAARVLIAGSGEQYGPVAPERLPVAETEPARPQNPYAVSKAAIDLLAGFYADAHGLDVLRARAFNHCGPGQTDTYVVASFAAQIAAAEVAGRPEVSLATGDLRPRRDFTDVRDIVRAYWLAAAGAPAGSYNVCSGRSTAIADILGLLARQSTVRVESATDPSRLREHEVMDIRGSHEKLTGATGWAPEIRLERTLADTLDWWRGSVAAGTGR